MTMFHRDLKNKLNQCVVAVLTVSVLSLSLVSTQAEAKRLGGGKTIGRQSTTVNRDAAPAAPTQAAPAKQAATPQQAAPQTPAQPARNRWLGPLAGLAAGLGIAALLSHFGMGEAFAVMWLIRKFRGGQNQTAQSSPYQSTYQPAYQGASQTPASGDFSNTNSYRTAEPAPQYNQFGSGGAASEPQAVPATPAIQLPAGFDVPGFVNGAKQVFVKMQSAFDAGDVNALREFTSDDVLAELKGQIAERAGAVNKTDVVTLNAELIAFETDVDEHVASVLFSGMIREELDAPAQSFEEVWNLVRPADGKGGWVIAGIQSLR